MVLLRKSIPQSRNLKAAAELNVKYLSLFWLFVIVSTFVFFVSVFTLREGRTWKNRSRALFALRGYVFQTKSLFVHRKFGVLPQHATNKSVICGCGSFCELHGQVVSKSVLRPKVRALFWLLPIRKSAIIFIALLLIGHMYLLVQITHSFVFQTIKYLTRRCSISRFAPWTAFKSRLCGFAAQKYSTKPQLKICPLNLTLGKPWSAFHLETYRWKFITAFQRAGRGQS